MVVVVMVEVADSRRVVDSWGGLERWARGDGWRLKSGDGTLVGGYCTACSTV